MFRFVASPTCDLHIRDLRIALLNYLCAKQSHSPFIVRIADIDKKSLIESKDDEILETLKLFGLRYDYLYYQSENFKYHLQFASTLLDKKKAFICFCSKDKASPYDGTCENLSPEEVLNNPHPFVIRLKASKDNLDSFVMMTQEKYPTNTFACACDDMLQGVSCIIDEATQLLDAPQQTLVRKALGYDQEIPYMHAPTLHVIEDETCNVKELLDQGFMPEAILNYLLLLGNPTPTEIFSLEEAISWFDITKTSQEPVHFDRKKLCSINVLHIKSLSDMELSKRLGYACENIGRLAKLYTQECSTTFEIKQKIDAIFAKKALHPAYENESKLLQKLILEAPYFEKLDDFQTYLITTSRLEGESFFKPLYFWLTGAKSGLELALVYPLIKTYLKEIVR